MSRRFRSGSLRSSGQRIFRAIIAACRESLLREKRHRQPRSITPEIPRSHSPIRRVDRHLDQFFADPLRELLDGRLGTDEELVDIRLDRDVGSEPGSPPSGSVPISLENPKFQSEIWWHTHCMTAQARYLVLSLYEIPAMQITTSCGSRASGFPFDKVRLVAGSRRFFAYSRAAHEAPSFSSGSSWTVSLRWKRWARVRSGVCRGENGGHSRSTFGKDGDRFSRLERIERRREQFLIVLRGLGRAPPSGSCPFCKKSARVALATCQSGPRKSRERIPLFSGLRASCQRRGGSFSAVRGQRGSTLPSSAVCGSAESAETGRRPGVGGFGEGYSESVSMLWYYERKDTFRRVRVGPPFDATCPTSSLARQHPLRST